MKNNGRKLIAEWRDSHNVTKRIKLRFKAYIPTFWGNVPQTYKNVSMAIISLLVGYIIGDIIATIVCFEDFTCMYKGFAIDLSPFN